MCTQGELLNLLWGNCWISAKRSLSTRRIYACIAVDEVLTTDLNVSPGTSGNFSDSYAMRVICTYYAGFPHFLERSLRKHAQEANCPRDGAALENTDCNLCICWGKYKSDHDVQLLFEAFSWLGSVAVAGSPILHLFTFISQLHENALCFNTSIHIGSWYSRGFVASFPPRQPCFLSQVTWSRVLHGQSDSEEGCLRVPRFPLPVPMATTAPYSSLILSSMLQSLDIVDLVK